MATQAADSKYAEREKFIAQVRQFEVEAIKDPTAYFARCRRIIALGYVVVFSVVVLCLAAMVATGVAMAKSDSAYGVGIKVMLVLGIFCFIVIKVLFTRFEEPDDGVLVSRTQAPGLWAEVDRIAKEVNSPPIHKIRMTMDWNASASQIPAFGIIGRTDNTLRYGLPLMSTETLDEARSTIAHELGHFAGNHSKTAAWAYRVVDVWHAAARGAGSGFTNVVFKPFLNWYLPKLEATTFPLRRNDEYEADRAGTAVAGALANATSLVRFGTQYKAIEKATSDFYGLASIQPEPPSDGARVYVDALRVALPTKDEFKDNLAFSLSRETSYDSTHPALNDRLRAIDPSYVDPEFLTGALAQLICQPVERSAATELLGQDFGKVQDRLSAHWAAGIRDAWARRHREVSGQYKEVLAAEEKGWGNIAVPELRRHLESSAKTRGPAESVELAKALLEKEPDNGLANYIVGSVLARDLSAGAFSFLDRAAEDPETRLDALEATTWLAEQLGDRDRAAKSYDLAVAESEIAEKYFVEGYQILKRSYRPWVLEEGERERVLKVLKACGGVREAYAVEYDSKARPGLVHHLIVVVPIVRAFSSTEKVLQKVKDEIRELGLHYIVMGPKESTLEFIKGDPALQFYRRVGN